MPGFAALSRAVVLGKVARKPCGVTTAVVGDGRVLPFLPDPLARLVLFDVEGRGLV